MARLVVVAEKPSVAREIARVLRCTKKGEGYLEGDGYVVTWALGHLIGQVEPEELDEKFARWKTEDLPILPEDIPLKIIRGRKKQFDIIKKLINDKETESLICATDAGREGELIFRWIYAYAKCKKPFKRLWISSMTDEAIQKGLSELQDGSHYDGLYKSAKSRAWADWVVGMNATRAYTVRYGALLSIGRVQTPTLAFLVKRQREIDAFVPDDYYVITADFGDYKAEWRNPENGKNQTGDETLAKQVQSRVKGKTGVIQKAEKVQKSQNAPLLYDLTELQRDCNRAFGFTAKKTLQIAQDLYEKRKLITYPRTDSRFLTADVAKKIRSTLSRVQIPDLNPAIAGVLGQEKLNFSRIVNDKRVTDHHAIIPTGTRVDFSRLSADEQKVYDRIARRLVATLMPPWVYDETTIETMVQSAEAQDVFTCRGRMTVDAGWKALYASEKEKGAVVLPDVKVGDERKASKVTVKKNATKPPAQYTEATLLSAMEHAGRQIEDETLREQMKDCGLGTPATRAAIIERILTTGYAKREKKSIVATQKGMQLISILPEQITSAVMTGKWEAALAHMASGESTQSDERFDESIAAFVRFLVQDAVTSKHDVTFEREYKKGGKTTAKKAPPASLGTCPLCGQGTVHENTKAFYCSRWKDGCKLTMWKNALTSKGGPLLTAKLVTLLLEKGEVVGSTGKIYFDAQKSVTFDRNNT
ncbi:MAG: DNA topoisomerase 3 [Clostridia bacterium]|nr:DNA topoisomerase 3 [Clostridia bacterium]